MAAKITLPDAVAWIGTRLPGALFATNVLVLASPRINTSEEPLSSMVNSVVSPSVSASADRLGAINVLSPASRRTLVPNS